MAILRFCRREVHHDAAQLQVFDNFILYRETSFFHLIVYIWCISSNERMNGFLWLHFLQLLCFSLCLIKLLYCITFHLMVVSTITFYGPLLCRALYYSYDRVRPSVHLSVTRWHCVKTTQARITKPSPADSPKTVGDKKLFQKFERIHPERGR